MRVIFNVIGSVKWWDRDVAHFMFRFLNLIWRFWNHELKVVEKLDSNTSKSFLNTHRQPKIVSSTQLKSVPLHASWELHRMSAVHRKSLSQFQYVAMRASKKLMRRDWEWKINFPAAGRKKSSSTKMCWPHFMWNGRFFFSFSHSMRFANDGERAVNWGDCKRRNFNGKFLNEIILNV